MSAFLTHIANGSSASAILLSVALMLLAGFAATRLTKLAGLPNVTAYICAGILVGPCALNLIPAEVVRGMDFITDIALACGFMTSAAFNATFRKQCGVTPLQWRARAGELK